MKPCKNRCECINFSPLY